MVLLDIRHDFPAHKLVIHFLFIQLTAKDTFGVHIFRGHPFFTIRLGEVLMQQLGVAASAPALKSAFVVRDIFQLKFGHYREAKKLLDEAAEKRMLPEAQQMRVLTDFTGDSYRLIFEEGFENLADYEISLGSSMKADEWQEWYERFKPLVEKSHREILRQVV